MKVVIILGFILLIIFATIGFTYVLFKAVDYYIVHNPYRNICLVCSIDGKHCKVYNKSNPYDCLEKFQSEFKYKDRTLLRVKKIKILK